MVEESSTNRRVLVGVIIVLAVALAAIGGRLDYVLRSSTPQGDAVESGRIQPQWSATAGVTVDRSRPTATSIAGTGEGTSPPDGPVVGEAEPVVGLPVSATDVAGLARGFDEEQALEHIAYLASDALDGRQPGTPGGRAAGKYIAERFEAYGLQPAGIGTTYYQTFTVPYGRIDSLPVLDVILPGGEALGATYDYRTDYRALTGGYLGAGEGEGPVVWLNECLQDDYAGLDMVGKVAMCHYSADPAVYREAIEHQVGGLLLFDWAHDDEVFRRGGYRETAWVPET
ncbi:MAG: hypothetical protein ACP5JJ_14905, partial [Anaerolineae bacterium]